MRHMMLGGVSFRHGTGREVVAQLQIRQSRTSFKAPGQSPAPLWTQPACRPQSHTAQQTESVVTCSQPQGQQAEAGGLRTAGSASRRTVRTELISGQIYGFDQLQGILKILVNVRMTAVVLRGGGLLVNNPILPTDECLELLNELVEAHGPVKYITLSSVAFEHKTFVGPFAKKFPDAELWVAPGQWAFPLNIPFELSLWPRRVTGHLRDTEADSAQSGALPWADELDCALLRVGGSAFTGFTKPWFVDVAWFHRRSHTLLVTESVLQIPSDPLPICEIDPEPLLLRATDVPGKGKEVENTAENRRKGWWRVCLFATFVVPSKQKNKSLTYDGFAWEDGWEDAFLCFADKLIVHPILRVLCFNRRPDEVLRWAGRVATWDFTQIIPSHFDGPISASPKEFQDAFSFLSEADGDGGAPAATAVVFPEEELASLRGLDADAVKFGTSEPPVVYKGR